MVRQGQKEGMRWRALALPFLLSVLVMLLLYLLSPDSAVGPGILSTERAPAPEKVRTWSHSSGATIRQVVQRGDLGSNGLLLQQTGHLSDSVSVVTPLCHRCAFFIEQTSLSKSVPPGGLARYELSVKNTGECDGKLSLSPSSRQGWEVETKPSSPIALSAGGSVAVVLNHIAPTDALSDTVDVVTLAATLDCTSCGNSARQTLFFTTKVERVFGVELSPDRFSSAAAGETVHFTHTLVNKGNHTAVFSFESSSALGSSIVMPPETTVGPYRSKIVPFDIVVLPSAEKGQTDTVVITATLTNAPHIFDSVVDQIQVLVSGCDVDLYIPEPVQSAMPGESVTYTLSVQNTGVYPGIAGIKVNPPEGWPSPVVILPPATTLLPEASADWKAILTVPLDEEPGEKTTLVTAVLTSTVFSKTNTAPGNISTLVLTPRADIEAGLVKTLFVTDEVINGGTEVTFAHTVTNTGNLAGTFDFQVHSAQGWAHTVPSSDSWQIDESKLVTFSVTIPPRASIFSDTLVITAIPQCSPAHSAAAIDGIRDGRVFLPVVIYCGCPVEPLQNGDFETGDLSSWRYGGKLPVELVSGLSGCCSAQLGHSGFGCSSVPEGSAWLEQTFSVPSGPPACGQPRLSFRYEMHTQDRKTNDAFEVYLKSGSREYLILEVGNTGSKTGCGGDEAVISGTCTIDLVDPTDCNGNPIDADFLCTDVTLRFENSNLNHNWYNTWTLVDDVAYTW